MTKQFLAKYKKGQNVFVTFLNLLGVKHTQAFSNRYFGEHPHKYNLFGLSKMLSEYGIESKGFKTENKEKAIQELTVPFVAHLGGDFVVVYKITFDKIYYLWQGKEVINTLDEFLQSWSGTVLLAEADENSIEPDYKENHKKEWAFMAQKYLLLLATGLLAVIFYLHNALYENIGLTVSLIVNLTGIFVCYLLVLKQLHIHSEYADKICSLFKKSDCNNVLESKASKLWDIIGWSEIGLGYFIANTLIILCFPFLFSWLALVNICALPYTVWSVWYQKMKARQWCPLCLAVQLLLWMVFVTNLSFGFIQIPDFQIENLTLTGIVYFIPVVVINLLIPQLAQVHKMGNITQEFNALKTSEDVFCAFLKKQQRYDADKSTSRILFGNRDAEILITVLTNPHCGPCAWMHTRVEKLLQENNHSICIQYIFTSFNADLESSARFLIAVYLNQTPEETKKIYGEWFREGQSNREEFFQQYNWQQDETTEVEFLRHKQWKEESQLNATPTVLVNGHKLPDNYKIEDLKYFTNLNIDIK